KNHPWLFDGEKVRQASDLAVAMRGGEGTEEAAARLGLPDGAIQHLGQINRLLHDRMSTLLQRRSEETTIPADEMKSILHPENDPLQMRPLAETVTNLAARYIVQQSEGKWE